LPFRSPLRSKKCEGWRICKTLIRTLNFMITCPFGSCFRPVVPSVPASVPSFLRFLLPSRRSFGSCFRPVVPSVPASVPSSLRFLLPSRRPVVPSVPASVPSSRRPFSSCLRPVAPSSRRTFGSCFGPSVIVVAYVHPPHSHHRIRHPESPSFLLGTAALPPTLRPASVIVVTYVHPAHSRHSIRHSSSVMPIICLRSSVPPSHAPCVIAAHLPDIRSFPTLQP
jgi:hypothetical protein